MPDIEDIKIEARQYKPLSSKQKAFCQYYVESHNGQEAATRAGYAEKTARAQASRLLTYKNIREEIQRLNDEIKTASIATAQEVMEYFTRVMKGEEKDQFGLEASLSERTKAAQELARRTVDLENRIQGKADNVIEIKLDWNRDENELPTVATILSQAEEE